MSAEHIDDEALQQLHDGALDAARLQNVTAHLSSCESCQKRGGSFDRLQHMLRISADEVSAGLDADAMFARISEGVAAERTAAAVAGVAARAEGSWWTRLVAQYRWAPAASVMVAATAAVLLTLYKPIEPEDAQEVVGLPPSGGAATATPTPPVPEPKAPEVEPAAAQAAVGGARAEVVEVDFGSHSGAVFEIAMDDGTSTPVVWINDDTGE